MKKSISSPRRPAEAGFALIVTISLMILLTLLAVGLLTLSSVSVRGSGQSQAIAEARANARMAMILAIGELQKHAGPDQRVTATGAILEDGSSHPHWTGVWESWKAGSGTPSGGDEPSDHATIPTSLNRGMSPSYTDRREDHFRSWLVSLTPGQAADIDRARGSSLTGSPSPNSSDSAVELVSEGTLGTGNSGDHVYAGLVNVKPSEDSQGRFGWWIGDESTKARLLEDHAAAAGAQSIANRIFRHQAPGNTGHGLLEGFEGVGDSTEFSLASTRPTLDLLDGVVPDVARGRFHDATPHSFGLLCDVREGGMKRDLSGLLDQPINLRDKSDDFMLYRFGRDEDQVPIQDLAAYYQLYREQVQFSSREVRRGIHVKNPDFGQGGDAFRREYTNLYRLPVPIKVQFLLSLIAEPRTADEKRANPRNRDSHKLNVGISPAITLWNPYNVPLAMNLGPSTATQFRFFNLPMAIRWTKEGKGYTSTTANSIAWLANGAAAGDRDTGFTVYFSGTREVIFEPGQVRVFSLANTSLRELKNSDTFVANREVVAGWNPERYIRLKRSDRSQNTQHIEPPTGSGDGALTFSANDRISFTIEPNETRDLANGSALQFFNRQSSVGGAQQWMARQYQLVSRLSGAKSNFNRDMMELGMPEGETKLEYEAKSGREIIAGTIPFLLVNLTAGCETSELSNTGPYGGRHFASRPFLHSSPVVGTVFMDREDPDGLYQHGWNWWVEDVNSAFEANISIDRSNNGYYGGGYTAESGATHIVQQEVPVAPPISIAALSHAQLGGYSLGNSYLGPGASNTSNNFIEVTASGQGGLFPHTVQAIGNSYAHPHLSADRAYGTWRRHYSEDQRPVNVTFADHSYLANKALWDEYFFSSVADTRGTAFSRGTSSGTPLQNAREFFFNGERLPNSRMTPYLGDLDEDELRSFFDRNLTNDKGIDLLSSHMMVEGPFNINSTSVEAWRALFASLKGKNIAYLDAERSLSGTIDLSEETPDGTPVASFSLPNGESYRESSDDPAEPAQWRSWRELTDDEIDELAEAMVRQVRLRGPFLSLSEFINRRLDGSDKELALKGALQAAIDDPSVSINEGFRSASRTLDPAETSDMRPAFPEALEGPVAYGSAAYVDQADILRGLAGQLTPRGDTFVIRTYGDSLDASGKVRARAWCSAVVQRVPDYLDGGDDDHLKHSELQSDNNRQFGRQFHIVSFRYLQASEI
ncbi:hypothetical protein HAHE_33610 [Haloferula helveola]|uniref:Verru_Chthon cassette protein A n=1 Tax=Haloferula helveola TaxID=490095 RepID=A0ABM7RNI9_9BACT|nr:hypothetical protein HAHE_33610 [Haloferula helveola]